MNRSIAECAKANFENLEKAVPMLKQHPYYLIAKAQLDESLGYSKVEDTLKPHHKITILKTEEVEVDE